MDDGALINGVIRIYHLGGREAKERIDGDEDNADGILMNGTSPLEIMVHGDGERGSNVSFPKGGEVSVIGLMNKGKIGM